MPQTTSASYNIGNSRQSARSNSFNRRNSGELANQQNIIAERLRLVNEAKLLKQKQLANRPKLAILFNPNTYPPDALKLMEYLKDDTSASRFSIINYTDLEKTLEEQYNLGFRFFASPTIGSFELYTYCIPFCKKYADALLFTTYSTQYFEDGVLPFNIICSSVNDKDLTHYIVNEILYKVHTLTKESAPVYYEPISYLSLDNIYPIFRKIVYIYTEKDANGNTDTHSENYRQQLLNAVNSQNGRIEIQAFKITDDNFILPEEVKTLLSANPVSGLDFASSNKTMFILNSYSPEKILQLFDEEYMYDNYFIFGYVFTSLHYTSKYKFNYAICPVGNYSFEGYKTAGFLPGGRQLSPFLYSISDVILKLLPYYTQIYYKYPNFSSNEFNLYFINRMKQINLFVDDNYWYERKIFTYYIGKKDGDLSNAQYNRHIFFKYKFNDGTAGQNIPKTFVYSFVNTNLPAFDISIHLPVINTSNTFSLLNTNVDVSGNKTTVTIYFELNNSSEILENDGLTFNKNQDVINYYKNNSNIEITKFSGIPLSRAGEQFANLQNLVISAIDTPSILQNTSLNKAFYNCSNFNSNISSWNVSKVTNMDSMFENATNFNNNFSQLKWNCLSLITALNFGKNSSLYGSAGDYKINPGNGIRIDELTSIETPTKTLTQSNSSLPLKSGTFRFSISDLETLDSNYLPIINSTSFKLSKTQNYDSASKKLTVDIAYSYKIILGNDGMSFKNCFTSAFNKYFNSSAVTILQFGNIPLSKDGYQFTYVTNLIISEADTPTILPTTSLERAFFYSVNFNSNINNWNVSNVTNMNSMFYACNKFNQAIGSWNVSNVKNMIEMFSGANSFNQAIGSWDVSKVTDMSSMFQNASAFNQPIGSWNVSNVTNMNLLFYVCNKFNQPLNNWNVLNVTNMISMFSGASSFNQPIGSWNVSKVIDMSSMFQNASAFNQPLNNWNVSNVTRMASMFENAISFNNPIGSWIMSSVWDMSRMFENASAFNQNIGSWNVSNVKNMRRMFLNASIFNQNINNWNVSKVGSMESMFQNASAFNNNNTPMNWNCNSNVIANSFGSGSALYINNGDYKSGFGNASRSNEKSSIETPIYTFTNIRYSFDNTGLSTFDNSKIPIINSSSSYAISTRFTISGNITTVSILFNTNSITISGEDGLSFKNVASYYGSNNVTILQFGGIPLTKSGEQFANLSNLVISATDTPSILQNTSLERAFYNCTNFNSVINNWNFSGAINMKSMFKNATKFNQNISSWNVSKVTNMDSMFENATNFNNNNTPMNWNCFWNVIADNFGTGSALYGSQGYSADPKTAVRNDGTTSIETPTVLRPLTAGIFIYRYDNTGLTPFSNSANKVPVINDNGSFFDYRIYPNSSGNITTVEVVFKYRTMKNNDGLTFKNVLNYFGSKTVTIIQFDGIALSSENNYKFLDVTTPIVINVKDDDNPPKIVNYISEGIPIYYKEFRNNTDNTTPNPTVNNQPLIKTINIPNFCRRLRAYLVGAGGSGGAGGGDTNGKDGTNGAGGGGGEYVYREDALISGYKLGTGSDYTNGKIELSIGTGGNPVSGGSNNNGKDGIAGGATTIQNTYTTNGSTSSTTDTIYTAKGGGGGDGGHPSSSASPGIGGSGSTGIIKAGANSSGMTGGLSGYSLYNSNSSDKYGNGGNGTTGTTSPNKAATGLGQNGYAKILFIT